MSIVAGRNIYVLFNIIWAVILIILPRLSKRGAFKATIRRLPAMDAIDESVARATEMNRPVVYSPGFPRPRAVGLSDRTGIHQVAGLDIMGYVAGLCARNDVEFAVPCPTPDLVPLAYTRCREAYMEEGKGDAFGPEKVYFVTTDPNSYLVDVLATLARLNAAVFYLIGPAAGAVIGGAEGAHELGCVVIGGQARIIQVPSMMSACDYMLMGEELFVAASYITQDPVRTGSIFAEDIVKIFLTVVGLIGVLLMAVGLTWMQDFLRL